MKRTKAGTSKVAAEARRARFVEAYIRLNGNGTQAAIEAGFPRKSAHVRAAELVKDRKVFEAIVERKAQILAELQRGTLITQEEVLEDMTQAMRFDPALLYDAKGAFRKIGKIPLELRRQLEGTEVKEVKIGKAGKVITTEMKYPKHTAVREQAMKFFGLFKKHQEQVGRAAGAAAGEAAGRAVAEALDFNEIEKRVDAKLRARRRAR